MAAVTLSNASLTSAREISTSLESRISRSGETARTELSLVQADIVGSGTNIDFTVRNSGQTAVKDFSDWPTIPQVYINGEFIGGCDIIMELHQNGELKKIIDQISQEK